MLLPTKCKFGKNKSFGNIRLPHCTDITVLISFFNVIMYKMTKIVVIKHLFINCCIPRVWFPLRKD